MGKSFQITHAFFRPLRFSPGQLKRAVRSSWMLLCHRKKKKLGGKKKPDYIHAKFLCGESVVLLNRILTHI